MWGTFYNPQLFYRTLHEISSQSCQTCRNKQNMTWKSTSRIASVQKPGCQKCSLQTFLVPSQNLYGEKNIRGDRISQALLGGEKQLETVNLVTALAMAMIGIMNSVVRAGMWTTEEQEFSHAIIEAFHARRLGPEHGTSCVDETTRAIITLSTCQL